MEIRTRQNVDADLEPVSATNPLPTSVERITFPNLLGATPVFADYLWALAAKGKLFYSADSANDQVVTAQTTYSNTTPSFLLDVPKDTTAVPLYLDLSQTGSVAGGAINIFIEIDRVNRYSTGGTSEKVFNPNKNFNLANKCLLYSGATALAGYGIRIQGLTVAPDVQPAEGVVTGPLWRPVTPMFLHGPAAWLIFTYAATTGPTWQWSIGWAEFRTEEIA